jgi:hypothetical protein
MPALSAPRLAKIQRSEGLQQRSYTSIIALFLLFLALMILFVGQTSAPD